MFDRFFKHVKRVKTTLETCLTGFFRHVKHVKTTLETRFFRHSISHTNELSTRIYLTNTKTTSLIPEPQHIFLKDSNESLNQTVRLSKA